MFKPLFGDTLLYEHHTTSLVFNDPPLHTHVRKAIGDALSQRALVALAPGLQQFIEGLLDRIEDQGEFDVMADFATRIPVEVIGNLLRLPNADRGILQRWASAILGRWNSTCRRKNWITVTVVSQNFWLIWWNWWKTAGNTFPLTTTIY